MTATEGEAESWDEGKAEKLRALRLPPDPRTDHAQDREVRIGTDLDGGPIICRCGAVTALLRSWSRKEQR
jgi:hypothetical protein